MWKEKRPEVSLKAKLLDELQALEAFKNTSRSVQSRRNRHVFCKISRPDGLRPWFWLG